MSCEHILKHRIKSVNVAGSDKFSQPQRSFQKPEQCSCWYSLGYNFLPLVNCYVIAAFSILQFPSKHFSVLEMFERKHLAKVKNDVYFIYN